MSKFKTSASSKLSIFVFLLIGLSAVLSHAGAEISDPYATLGVSRDSSMEEIKSAYRKLSRLYHPDLNGGDKAAAAKARDVISSYQKIVKTRNSEGLFGTQKSGVDYQSAEATIEALQRYDQLDQKQIVQLLDQMEGLAFGFVLQRNKNQIDSLGAVLKNISATGRLMGLPLLTSYISLNRSLATGIDYLGQDQYLTSEFNPLYLHYEIEQILIRMANSPEINGRQIISEIYRLAMQRSKRAIFAGGPMAGMGYFGPRAQLNSDIAATVYEFAVKKKLITDAKSLIQFTDSIVGEILFSPVEIGDVKQTFLQSQFGFTLSTFNQASDLEIIDIISRLRGVESAMAYEELVRSGRVLRMNSNSMLNLLRNIRKTQWKFLNENRNQEVSDEMNLRLRRANLTLTKSFSKEIELSSAQAQEFRQLAEISYLEFSKLKLLPRKNFLSPREYSLGLNEGVIYKSKDSGDHQSKLDSGQIFKVSGGQIKCSAAVSR
jgi:hypothetical protein